MFNRFRIALAHPRFIGLFYKDSALKIFIYLFSLFVLYLGISALRVYGTDHFNYNFSKGITSMIYLADESDIEYDSSTNMVTGSPIVYKSNGFILNFLANQSYAHDDSLVIRFNESTVDVIYYGFVINNYKYSDLNINSFSLKNIYEGNISDIISFQDTTNLLLNDFNTIFSSVYMLSVLMEGILYFAIAFAICLVLSYYTNYNINRPVRIRLCLYSCGIFYIFMMFAMLFNTSIFQYLAFLFPLIYTTTCFKSIVRVDKNRSSSNEINR